MRGVLLSATLMILVPLASVAAQERPVGLEPGARVRVRLDCGTIAPGRRPCQSYVGSVTNLTPEALTIAPSDGGAERTVPMDGIRSVELSLGRRSSWKTGAVVGAGVGGLLGGIIGGATAPEDGPEAFGVTEESGRAMAGIAIGLPVGALIGGIVGSRIRVDRWQKIELDATRLTLAPRGGAFHIALTASI